MPTVYITPQLAFTTNKIQNPYITDLANALEINGSNIIRSPYVYALRMLDLLLYVKRTDILLLNWPEDICARPLGRVQIWLLKKFIKYIQATGGKVVWTMHNKISHQPERLEEKKAIINWLQLTVDLIVVHSRQGLSLITESNKAFYFPHPFRPALNQPSLSQSYQYDIIIWGNINPYKGISPFLEFLHKNDFQHKYKILICGKCTNGIYWKELNKLANENITLINEFLTDDKLDNYICKSRVVLFTHAGESVLTSGTVAESLRHNKTIVAPDKANFSDLGAEGVIYTYNSYLEAINFIDYCVNEPEASLISLSKIHEIINRYSWNAYTSTLVQRLSSIDN